MIWNYFNKVKIKIFTPVNGKIIPLEEVPDPVFSEKLMGEGVAIIPTSGNVFAPVAGTIIQIANTKHAVGILAEDGSEILIHIGLDTVALKGAGFTVAVNMGDKVEVGQLLIEVDWKYLRNHAKSIVTPIVITNSHDSNKKYSITAEKKGIPGKTVLITVEDK